MWLDAIALAVLCAFVLLGAVRGALATGMGLLALVVGYGAAIFAAPRFGPAAASALGLPELLGVPVAGTLAFLAAFCGVSVVAALLRRAERERLAGEGRDARDRFLGGVFGALRGALVVLLLSWLALWLDALRATGTTDLIPELGDSAAAAVTSSVVEAGVGAAVEDAGLSGRVVARMAARPAVALGDLQAVVEHPAIEGLRGDPLFWTYVEHGSVDAALNRASFLRITHDDDLRARLGEIGLVDPAAADDPAAFRAAAADVLRDVGPRIRGLREDPELRRLVEDPEVQGMIQSGDTLALMSHPAFRQLVARVASAPAAP